ncbi:hypothetical protein EVAR_102579_1 [Eumeta japonica]|uniref:Uncharacterized protein n=1 Tax=Eumeta variegata TaxID=151549 RepID=A0A4C1SH66_EUMVA|nr:hypothetical protein EVAR_102579_1 [Eumeta japonica]
MASSQLHEDNGTTVLSLYIPSPLILNELAAILSTLMRPYILLGGFNVITPFGVVVASISLAGLRINSTIDLQSILLQTPCQLSPQAMISVADDMFPLKKHSVVAFRPWCDQECTRAAEKRS